MLANFADFSSRLLLGVDASLLLNHTSATPLLACAVLLLVLSVSFLLREAAFPLLSAAVLPRLPDVFFPLPLELLRQPSRLPGHLREPVVRRVLSA